MTGRHFIIAGALVWLLTLATAPASAEWLYQSKSEVEPGHTTFTADTTDVGVLSFACDSSHGGRTWLAMPPQNYAAIGTFSGSVPASTFTFRVDGHRPIGVDFGMETNALMRAPISPAGVLLDELLTGNTVAVRSPTGLVMHFPLRGSSAAIGKVLSACRIDRLRLSPAARRATQSTAPVTPAPHTCFCCIKGRRVCQ